jgi:hypothetical protein
MNHPSPTALPDELTDEFDLDTFADTDADTDPAMLAHLLRAHAAGLRADTAAVELLITHRYWLTRPGFTTRFVHTVINNAGHRVGAWLDWPAAITALNHGQLPCSSSQADLLRIAAALGAELPLNLRQALGGLDHHTITAVTAALTAANGTA